MYLVTLSLHDDRLTDKSHLMTKVEKLQSFDITSMHSEFEVEPAQNIANDDGAREIERRLDWVGIFVPEKGGSFEQHLYKYKDIESLCNESVISAILTTDIKDVCHIAGTFLNTDGADIFDDLSSVSDWVCGGEGHGIMMAYFAIDLY